MANETEDALFALLLETAKALYAEKKLHIFKGDMIIEVPYLAERPDGVIVRKNSLSLLYGSSRCLDQK